ncbi:hypothetical protein F5984_15185 [Rudanella paleaurantiibacter]|uniref:Uncharacterized protein n=1 Tax=Rudanella paleaurantiibacter TaxID=2614655 RepID=A0A7J5TZC2_9BACT|nr:hypothetical protein [Rudanella paleaurantiibacter]KAB7730484.1 hypothetical protein F5984_15185 [Rudanella paleaurantiibacter]
MIHTAALIPRLRTPTLVYIPQAQLPAEEEGIIEAAKSATDEPSVRLDIIDAMIEYCLDLTYSTSDQ